MSTVPANHPGITPHAAAGLGEPEPTWEVAYLYPRQGFWTEQEYLALTTNQLVEFVDGKVEFLAMPNEYHQFIMLFLFRLLEDWAKARDAGRVIAAPFKTRLWPGRMREPDVMFMSRANDDRRTPQYWVGADFAIEVVSDDDPDRDLVVKRAEYARAGIPEYWIVDPRSERVTVLKLDGEAYAEHGAFGRGERAASATLEGFGVDVSAVFDVR